MEILNVHHIEKLKKILRNLFVCFVAFCFYLSFVKFGFTDSLNNEVDVQGSKNSENEDSVSENAATVQPTGGGEDMEIKKFYRPQLSVCDCDDKKYEHLVKAVDDYVQRYISLFLITFNLLEYKVTDKEEAIKIDLEITISGEDLAFLQELSKTGTEFTHQRKLHKLDIIFSKIARLKERSYMEEALRYSKSALSSHIFNVISSPSFHHYLTYIVIFTISWITYYFIFKKPYMCIAMIFNSMIIWDSFTLYWKKIKDVDLDIYVKTLQLKEIPEDCYPQNMKWYHKVLNFVSQNDCFQYYKNLNKNPVEEVSLFLCIIDTYGLYLIQTPAKVLGAAVKLFTGEVMELWPWPFRYFVNFPLVLFVTVVAVIFILLMCGKRIRLSFFGAGLELGDCKPENKKTKLPIDSASGLTRNNRKLRPWTKTKFNRRLDMGSAMRRKLLLKASKSLSEIPDGVVYASTSFSKTQSITGPPETLDNSDADLKLSDSLINHDCNF